MAPRRVSRGVREDGRDLILAARSGSGRRRAAGEAPRLLHVLAQPLDGQVLVGAQRGFVGSTPSRLRSDSSEGDAASRLACWSAA